MAWFMPAETAPHERVWMAFPPGGYTLGESEAEADQARATWATVANTVVDWEPVTMVVAPGQSRLARTYLTGAVDVLEAPLNDAWMRDIGPTFVTNDQGELGAVDWRFNGWGQQDWAQWDLDSQIGSLVARYAGATLIPSDMVNEGGGIHVDGTGVVLATKSVQLDPLRNPGWSYEQVEQELADTIGATQVIWLPRGLSRDSERYGTKGHVDIVATFSSPDTLLLHEQPDPAHPDRAILAQIERRLDVALAALPDPPSILRVPAPTVLTDAEGYVDYSYINHLVVNDAVIACTFDDPRDDEAKDILREAYAGREVIGIDAREIFARGGGIHCITQQQPRVRH